MTMTLPEKHFLTRRRGSCIAPRSLCCTDRQVQEDAYDGIALSVAYFRKKLADLQQSSNDVRTPVDSRPLKFSACI